MSPKDPSWQSLRIFVGLVTVIIGVFLPGYVAVLLSGKPPSLFAVWACGLPLLVAGIIALKSEGYQFTKTLEKKSKLQDIIEIILVCMGSGALILLIQVTTSYCSKAVE